MKHFDGLKETVAEISDLHAAMALLEWDQQTYMPSNSAADRSGQIGTLAKLAHEKASSAEFGRLIDAASRETASMPADSMSQEPPVPPRKPIMRGRKRKRSPISRSFSLIWRP